MTLPTMTFRRSTTRAPRAAFVWRARDLSLDAATGQVGTLVRTSAVASAYDSFGSTSVTVVRERPRWTDLYPQVATSVSGLILGSASGATTEYVSWPCDLKPGALSGLIAFMENETAAIGDAGSGSALLSIANPAVTTGPYLSVYASSNGRYAIAHDNDVSGVSSEMGTAPTNSQRVVLRWWLYSDGKVQIWQSINGAAETAASVSSTLSLGAIWGTAGSAAQYWLNTTGAPNVNSNGFNHFTGVVVMRGNQSQATLLQALAY